MYSTLDNKTLLEELIYAYNERNDYWRQDDYVNWTPAAEKAAEDNYLNILNEVLKRMEKDELIET